MKLVKSFEELFEKKLNIKRKYTDAYPAKTISSEAKVRNAILTAVSDGILTEEEFVGILKSINANKGWIYKNKQLFKIEEDKGGLKTYSLSKYGKKIFDAIIKNSMPKQINEALKVPYPDHGNKPVNVFVGRFQPFTLGHVKVFEQLYKKNGFPVVVLIVRSNKLDPEKSPFTEDIQLAMFSKMKKEYPFLEAAYVIPKAGIDDIFGVVRPAYEPMMWGFGTDRKKNFEYMINHQSYREQLGVNPEFKGFEILRGDDDISATKVREALKVDNESEFKKLVPKSLYSFYPQLKNVMNPIQEMVKSFEQFKNID
jgi:cytidyltransferase-like protein